MHEDKAAVGFKADLAAAADAQEPRKATFRSPALESQWTIIQPISHPEHPFLDPFYSPSSLMPAADYSPWIRERLAVTDWISIKELLDFITYEHQQTAIEKTFQNFSYSSFLSTGEELLNELMAITILCYRIPWTGHEDSRIHLLSQLILHSLVVHEFELQESSLEYLLKGANRLIRRQNKEMKEYGSDSLKDTVKITALRTNKSHHPGEVGNIFRKYPITFRDCISYSLDRGSPVPGTIRPQLHGEYGLRQFGLSDVQNAEFLTCSGLFTAPDDLSLLAKRLQKDRLLEIGVSANIVLKKSWRKGKMVEALLESDLARSKIAQEAPRYLVRVADDMKGAFDQWIKDCKRLKNVALCLATV